MSPCCSKWSGWMTPVALLVLVFAGGHWLGTQRSSASPRTLDWSQVVPAGFRTDTAASTKNMSVATAQIEEGVEGLYVLDHLTGNLNLYVLNVRSGDLGASYRANVLEHLQAQGGAAGGEAALAMVTGSFDFSNLRQGQERYANSICYVVDGNSGHIVGFTFAYSSTDINRGQLQSGELLKVVDWTARDQSAVRQ